MTDWSQLSHAYGSAEDIPAMFDRLEAEPGDEIWNDLWSALCHQGTAYSASFASLPRLATIAAGPDPANRLNAIFLAGAIMTDETRSPGDTRDRYATEIAALLRIANDSLRSAADPNDYIDVLQSVLGLEGVPIWSEHLDGLNGSDYEAVCPSCETELFIVIRDDGYFSCSDDYALDEEAERTPLRPAYAMALDGIGRRLHDTAVGDGQQEVATRVTYLFGSTTCTACGTTFPTAERIVANMAG